MIENIVEIIVLGTLGLFTFFGGVLFFVILYQKKVIRSNREKQELESQYQKDLLHSYIETQEKERQRIAADLHDGVGASLAAVKMMINRIKPEEESQQMLLAECKDIIQKTANSAREISHDLLPPSLETLGLKKIVERMSKNISSETLTMETDFDKTIQLSKKRELALFRIIQEMMNNSLKHAEASLIKVELKKDEKNYLFKYYDNGKGFSVENSTGLGFRNIQTRVEMIGAEHSFFSLPNEQNGIKISFSTNEQD